MLEEPPARSLLLLVSHAPGPVLADHPLALPPPDAAAARARGRRARRCGRARPRCDAMSDVKAAAAIADGSVARALDLLDGGCAQAARAGVDLLAQLPAVDPRALHALGDALGGADQRAFDGGAGYDQRLAVGAARRRQQDKRRLVRVAEVWEKINASAREAENTISSASRWSSMCSGGLRRPRAADSCVPNVAGQSAAASMSRSPELPAINVLILQHGQETHRQVRRRKVASQAPRQERQVGRDEDTPTKTSKHGRQKTVAQIRQLGQPAPLLHHHRDRLSEWRAAYRPRLRGDRDRRDRALHAARRLRRVLPHRHRRARPEDAADRGARRASRRSDWSTATCRASRRWSSG